MLKNKPPKILVVDDQPMNLYSVKKILDKLHFTIITADSGNSALTLLLDQQFDLILLDVNMPIMDGYETALLLRQLDESKNIPIIFLTARDQTKKLEVNIPFTEYIFKPIDPEALLNKITRHL